MEHSINGIKKDISNRIRFLNDEVIEIHVKGLTEEERLELINTFYMAYQKENTTIRKTYKIRSDVAASFAQTVKEDNKKIGRCVTELITNCIISVKKGNSIPSPAPHVKGSNYAKKSYQVQSNMAKRFDELCIANHVPVGPILQTLMEHYLEKKAGNQDE